MSAVRVCKCGHEEAWHLVDARDPKHGRGVCNYGHDHAMGGCKCERFKVRGRAGSRTEPASPRKQDGLAGLIAALRGLKLQLEHVIEKADRMHSAGMRFEELTPLLVSPPPLAPEVRAQRATPPVTGLPKGEAVVLTAIAQHPSGVTRSQLTVLTGYKRSTRDAYIQRLREPGYIDQHGERIVATDSGRAELGPNFTPLPTGQALLEHWRARLPEGERVVLDVVASAYPKAVSREQISLLTDYARSSRDAYVQRLAARELVESVGRGEVRAAKELFE